MRLIILYICLAFVMLFSALGQGFAQTGVNDTIRLGAKEVDGKVYPFVFLPEFTCETKIPDVEELRRISRLRNNVYATYSYALAAAAIFNKVKKDIEEQPDRRSRKHYMKEVDRQLDKAFKEPLKNMSIEQGHVLIALINRQTGDNCYHVIRELKGGLSAMMWQSVGVFFNNNLTRDYEPTGRDKEIEVIVREMETSAAYSYQLYLQDQLMKKVGKK